LRIHASLTVCLIRYSLRSVFIRKAHTHTHTHTQHTPNPLHAHASGLGVLLAGSIPKAGVRFSSFEFFRARLVPAEGDAPASDGGKALRNLAAGLSAGVAEAVLIVTPLETVKVKNIESNRGLLAGISGIVRYRVSHLSPDFFFFFFFFS
jgi:hypothetical protein